MRTEFDVLVIGAGAAGLSAAQSLVEQAPELEVGLLEARNRIGGRIHTLEHPAYGALDLGAEFVHGYVTHTWNLIEKAGLAAYDVPDQHWLSFGGKLHMDPRFWDRLDQVFSNLKVRPDNDRTFRRYLDSRPFLSSKNKKLAISFVEGFDAADVDKVSESSLAMAERAFNEISGFKIFKLLGGHIRLIHALYHRCLLSPRFKISLGTPAHRIRWHPNLVEVQASHPDGNQVYRARRLILTVPISLLKNEDLVFDPALDQRKGALAKIEMGSVIKIVFQFHSRFWENSSWVKASGGDPRDICFLHNPSETFPTWWSALPLRSPLLTAWLGGPGAIRLAELSEPELSELALQSLARILKMDLNAIKEELSGFVLHHWDRDPYSRGAYSYLGVGGLEAQKLFAQPIEETLFFAGEATESQGLGGTVDGALISGERASREVLASLGVAGGRKAA